MSTSSQIAAAHQMHASAAQQPSTSVAQPMRILTPAEIQQKLEENAMLIKAVNDCQSVGRLEDCANYLQVLQANLMELAALADAQAAPQPAPAHALPPS